MVDILWPPFQSNNITNFRIFVPSFTTSTFVFLGYAMFPTALAPPLPRWMHFLLYYQSLKISTFHFLQLVSQNFLFDNLSFQPTFSISSYELLFLSAFLASLLLSCSSFFNSQILTEQSIQYK